MSDTTDLVEEGTVNNYDIIENDITNEVQDSYLRYSLSVIASRALPDVRDGLKPSQRRILFVMRNLGLNPGGKFRKSAKICGDTSGDFHPHGEAVVYPTMVRMSQPWVMRYPLVHGQGNFGSIDGDPPGAMRYTEARMTKETVYLMEDIEKDTVDLVSNYDETKKEPVVFPSRFNNLLCNGSSGIAVGMATMIPPHNFNEVANATLLVLDKPEVSIEEIMEVLPAPDFPTGGVICGTEGVISAYTTGRGKILVRGKVDLEENKDGDNVVVITEVPFGVNKSKLIESIAHYVENKSLSEVSDIRDESGRDGIRVVITLKKGSVIEVALNKLYKLTQLRTTVACHMLALDKGMPKVMNIKDILSAWIEHRESVVIRRTTFDLAKAKSKLELLEGFMVVLNNIDETIKIVKESDSRQEALLRCISEIKINERQANAVLDMKLYKITGMEVEKITTEYYAVKKEAEELKSILDSNEKVRGIIREEILESKLKNIKDKRLTEIDRNWKDILSIESLIPNKEAIITISKEGFLKRVDSNILRTQQRGGQGIFGMSDKKGGVIRSVVFSRLHDYLLVFTSKGCCHWIKSWQVPETSRRAQGQSIYSLIDKFDEEDKVSTILRVEDLNKDANLIFVTKKGVIKKTKLDAFSSPRRGGIIAINLDDGDKVINVSISEADQSENILIATKNGMVIRFPESELNAIGRGTRGVRGIRLKDNDIVVSSSISKEDDLVMFVSSQGFGKRTSVSKIRVTHRGGCGVKGINATKKVGSLVAMLPLKDESQLLLSTFNGKFIKISGNIKISGRVTQGVKLINLTSADDYIKDATEIEIREDEEGNIENSIEPSIDAIVESTNQEKVD